MRQASTSQVHTIRAPPVHDDLRARGQDPRCAPTHGAHEHPTREQDGVGVHHLTCVHLPTFSRPFFLTGRVEDRASRTCSVALLLEFRLKNVDRPNAEGLVRGVHPHRHAGRRAPLIASLSSPCLPQPPAAAREFMWALTQVPWFRRSHGFSARRTGTRRVLWEAIAWAVVLGVDDAEDVDVAQAARTWGFAEH
jgi:hypothetical protein